jgi:hypothetical protein
MESLSYRGNSGLCGHHSSQDRVGDELQQCCTMEESAFRGVFAAPNDGRLSLAV